ncbi:MAG: carbohydrate binding family 9 domain-containing protein [Bacteroidetes bacterium]|nr:carbohydrate binding family 9 domain-containing protein [Bacteroidota bacterium]
MKIPFTFFLFLGSSALAQNGEVFKPDSIKKEIEAVRIRSSLHIDGLLNEPEWQLAKPSPKFIQIEPHQSQSPTFETEVRVLYNQQYLYFGIFARDSLGKKALRATDFKRDFDYRAHDLISLAFDGFNDKRNAMSLVSNPYGVQRDFLSFDDLYYDIDWDGLWRVRTTRTDSGWVAEFAIPWQTLRYPKTTDTVQNWGFNVYRNRRLTNEITALSEFPRAYSSVRMNYAGILKNLQPPPPKPNIRFQPYMLGSYDHYNISDSTTKPYQTNGKFGGDLKWAINTNTVLDLTANTDFAQVDADRGINNVSRFSVFFPERRQFFLENASLFGVGLSTADDASGGLMRIQPFFSRKIGLDDNGNPIAIRGGGRFVYRSIKRNFGAIALQQAPLDTIPATNFLVGRYSENFGTQNRIGVLEVVKTNSHGSNIVSTIDGFFRLGEAHSLNTMIIHSATSNGGKQGFAGFAQYYYSTNQMKVWWTQSVVTKDFNPETGFVSRNDVIATTPGIFYYYRGKALPVKKILRAFEPSISLELYHQASTGKQIERSIIMYPIWLNFQSGAFFGYGIIPVYQNLTDPFVPLGVTILPGKYNYNQQQIWASTDPSKLLNLNVIYTWGPYFNGKLNSGDWKLQFAPIPHFSVIGRFNRNHFMGVGEAKIDKTVDLYSVEARIALNPRIQLIGFYQKNSDNNAENYNIRFSWEYQPLSYVYIVYNKNSFNNLLAKTQMDEHVIAKISFLKQF